MNTEERITRLERLEKLRYYLRGLLTLGWDEGPVAEDVGLEGMTSFKEIAEAIKSEIANIEYEI